MVVQDRNFQLKAKWALHGVGTSGSDNHATSHRRGEAGRIRHVNPAQVVLRSSYSVKLLSPDYLHSAGSSGLKKITFDDIDINGDGVIDRKEWDEVATRKEAMSRRTSQPPPRRTSIMPRVRSAFSGITLSCEMSLEQTAAVALTRVAQSQHTMPGVHTSENALQLWTVCIPCCHLIWISPLS